MEKPCSETAGDWNSAGIPLEFRWNSGSAEVVVQGYIEALTEHLVIPEDHRFSIKRQVKQVDRYLSNRGIDLHTLLPAWTRSVLGPCIEVLIALDWTDFDADGDTTLCAYVVTTHGRATPFMLGDGGKSSLTDGRRTYEDEDLHL